MEVDQLQSIPLPRSQPRAENGAVRLSLRFTGLAIATLLLLPAAPGQIAPRRPAPPAPRNVDARVDINHASLDEMLKVHGMTRSWAVRILRFRPYRSKQDLLDRGVVSSQVYDRIKDFIIAHRDKE